MAVRLSRGARQFLTQRGLKTIVLSLTDIPVGCCLGVAKDIGITFEPPRDPRGFWRRSADGVEVYIDRQLKAIDEVVIKRQGFWKLSSLYVDGLSVPL